MRCVIADQRDRCARRAALNASKPHGRYVPGWVVLVVSIVASASAAVARADDITYNIVDYPANEVLTSSNGTATIAGTIITDGTLGPLSAADIVGGTLSFTDPIENLTVSHSAWFGPMSGLQATATELVLTPGTSSSFSLGTPAVPGTYEAAVQYENVPGDGEYRGDLTVNPPPLPVILASFDSAPVPTTPGSIGANANWIIATVPEPGALSLLATAAVGLVGLVSWQSRRCTCRSFPARRPTRSVPASAAT
ncbi:MAG: hypothetical protein ACLP9L_13425 [Thermoguttaceae bacterium]